MDKPSGARTCLYTPPQLDIVFDDMARRAAGLFTGRSPITVIGILRRGAPLADRLTQRMVGRYGVSPPRRLDLRVKRYADDLTLLHPETELSVEAADLEAFSALAGHNLLVVDDVLYSGHSLLRVVDFLARHNPAEIRVAVLVDRGVTCLPVHADVIGVHLQVAAPDIVECNVPPYEPEFKIELLQPTSRD